MKRYFGLNNTEENLLVYGNLANSLVNLSLVAPLVYFGWCVLKASGLDTLSANYKQNSPAWNWSIIILGAFKILFWAFEVWCFAKATRNISKTENN